MQQRVKLWVRRVFEAQLIVRISECIVIINRCDRTETGEWSGDTRLTCDVSRGEPPDRCTLRQRVVSCYSISRSISNQPLGDMPSCCCSVPLSLPHEQSK